MDSIPSNFNYEYVATRIMLAVFKLMGFAPFNVRRSTRSRVQRKNAWIGESPTIQFSSSRFGCAYNLSLVVLHLCVLTLAVPDLYSLELPKKSRLSTVIELAACALGYTLIFMVWLIHGFRQKTTVRLLNRLFSLDDALLCLRSSCQSESGRLFFIVVCVTTALMQLEMIHLTHKTDGFLVSNYLLGFATIMTAWFAAQYTFTVKLIENRFRTMNRTLHLCYVPLELNSTYDFSVTGVFALSGRHRPNIATLRRAHSNLCGIASEISAFYSVPILVTVGHSCYRLIYSCYYFIITLIVAAEKDKLRICVYSGLWITNGFLPIVVLTVSVTHVIWETKKTGDIVQRLIVCSKNSHDDTVELKLFSLELLHREVQFNACGFFTLDGTLVLSVVHTVITYLIILIQFLLGRAARHSNSG